MKEKIFLVSHGDFDVTIKIKKVKNVRLTVKQNGEVVCTAPSYVSKKFLLNFLEEKKDWILETRKKMLENFSKQLFLESDTICFFGKTFRLSFQKSERSKVRISGDECVLFLKEITEDECKKLFDRYARRELKKVLEIYFEKWHKITGLISTGFKIRDMSSRWGTCNTFTKIITINLQIIKKPIQCLEYLILHELAHLKEKSHNQNFKNILTTFMPDWKKYRKLLKDPQNFF